MVAVLRLLVPFPCDRNGVCSFLFGGKAPTPPAIPWISAQTPVERLLSSWKGPFCTSILVGGRVIVCFESGFLLSRLLPDSVSRADASRAGGAEEVD